MYLSKEQYQERIISLLKYLNHHYVDKAKSEKSSIEKETVERNDGFDVLAEIEEPRLRLTGYALSIEKWRLSYEFVAVLDELSNLDILENPRLKDWWLNNQATYPNLCTTIALLDHLRLMLLEYLNSYKQPIT